MTRKNRVPEKIDPPELPLDAPDQDAFEREATRRINRKLTQPIPFEVEITYAYDRVSDDRTEPGSEPSS